MNPNLKVLPKPSDGRPEIQYADPADLRIDERYQRKLDEKRIAAWSAEGFDWMKFGVLTANLREDGKLYVEDGQHRLAFALKADKSPVPVLVSFGEEPEHEANLFVDLNSGTRPVKSAGRYIARRFAGDPAARALDAVIVEAGFYVPPVTEDSFAAINAVTVLESIAGFAGPESVGDMLWLLRAAWKDKPKQRSLRGTILRGVHWLGFNHVSFDLSESEAQSILRSLTQDELQLRAKSRQNQANRASSTADAVYRELLDEANKHRKSKLLYVPMRSAPLDHDTVKDIKLRFQAGQEIPFIAKKHGLGAGIVKRAIEADADR